MNVATLRSSSTTRIRTSSTLLRLADRGWKFVVHRFPDRFEIGVRREWVQGAQVAGHNPFERLANAVSRVRRQDGDAALPSLLAARRDDDDIAARESGCG